MNSFIAPSSTTLANTDAALPCALLASTNTLFTAQLGQLLAGLFTIQVIEGLRQMTAALESSPDLLLFDMALADETDEGWSAALHLPDRTFPFVTLSTEFDDAIRARALRTGADDHLMAPFIRENLLARLDGLLAAARFRTQHARVEMAAHESEERLQFTLAATQVGQWEVDLQDGAVQQSPRYDEIFGYAPGSKVWSYDEFLAHVHPEDRKDVARAIVEGWEFECRIVRVDQATRWLWGKGATLRTGGSNRQRRSGLIMDITQRKEAEGLLRDADRRKDEFLATLAHELRNPLAPLRNGLQIMKLAGDDAEVVAHTREMMERNLEHMVRLVNDLLDMSRISRGKLKLQKQRIEIAAVIQSVLETSGPLIDLAGHELTVTLPQQPVHLEADFIRLSQVVSNLLDNATKYTRTGGHIRLHVEAHEGSVLISVKDNGAGISRSMLSKVFEAFAQITPSLERTQGGLGIGLSIVKRLVEMHGGKVEALSAGRGTGSEFRVKLPLTEPISAPIAPQPPDKIDAMPSSRRILVVDDNIDSALSLSAILEMEGNEMRTAHDGLAALDVAAAFQPEVIFLDIGLPELNGYEVCRRIREHAWGSGIFIVALTGWGQQQDLERAQTAGFDRHLVKPVEIAVIEEVLDSVAASARVRRQV